MIDQLYNLGCLEGMKEFIPDDSIDLTVTSPPYNIGIAYDTWADTMPIASYWAFTKSWLEEVYRCLKPSGRIVLNCLYEANFKDNGGRVFVAGEFWRIMQDVGFNWAGLMDLKEIKPHRVKYSAWGSYCKPSAPYLYNPKECLIIAYKGNWKKEGDKTYEIPKDVFIECVSGEWNYNAVTKQLTKANFSEEIPEKAIQMLSYPGDIVMDPFLGSGTTCSVAFRLNRRYCGFEISKNYWEIAAKRLEQQYLQTD